MTYKYDNKVLDRFWAKVDKSGPDDCWNWNAGTSNKGYGRFAFQGKTRFAHRVSWLIANGSIKNANSYHGVCVLHRCDNPPCVNPKHLFLGTHQDNINDMVNKGRSNLGSKHGKSSLTESSVEFIRSCGLRSTALSRIFKVSPNTISEARFGRTWKHVWSPE